MKKIIFVLILGQLLTSCLDFSNNTIENLSIETDFDPIVINSQYMVRIPKYMKKSNSLNDDASLQYLNTFKETCVIIIDESKEDIISTFKELGEYNDSLSVVKNYTEIQLN